MIVRVFSYFYVYLIYTSIGFATTFCNIAVHVCVQASPRVQTGARGATCNLPLHVYCTWQQTDIEKPLKHWLLFGWLTTVMLALLLSNPKQPLSGQRALHSIHVICWKMKTEFGRHSSHYSQWFLIAREKYWWACDVLKCLVCDGLSVCRHYVITSFAIYKKYI